MLCVSEEEHQLNSAKMRLPENHFTVTEIIITTLLSRNAATMGISIQLQSFRNIMTCLGILL